MSAVEQLIQLGVLRIVNKKYIRIQVHTKNLIIIDALQRTFGGAHRAHGKYTQRWEVCKAVDVAGVGYALRPFLPAIAGLLIRYWLALPGRPSWEAARRLHDRLGGPSAHLRDILDL